MIERGTGAQRQLAVWRADRDLRTLVRKIVEATAVGVTGASPAATRGRGRRAAGAR